MILAFYDLSQRISSAWPKFRLKDKKGLLKKNTATGVYMSQ